MAEKKVSVRLVAEGGRRVRAELVVPDVARELVGQKARPQLRASLDALPGLAEQLRLVGRRVGATGVDDPPGERARRSGLVLPGGPCTS